VSVNPKVTKINIDLSFDENFEYSHKPSSSILSPTDKVFFAPDCINRSCTKGYFDISSEIYETPARSRKDNP
jgi:hypothetical protein